MEYADTVYVRQSNTLAVKWGKNIADQLDLDFVVLDSDEDAQGGIAVFSPEGESDDELLGELYIMNGKTTRMCWPQWAQGALYGYPILCDSEGRALLDHLRQQAVELAVAD